MQNTIETDLTRLCKMAQEWGASNARQLSVKDIIIDERVRLKCQVPANRIEHTLTVFFCNQFRNSNFYMLIWESMSFDRSIFVVEMGLAYISYGFKLHIATLL